MSSGKKLGLGLFVVASAIRVTAAHAEAPARTAPPAVSRLMTWVSAGVTVNVTQEHEEREYCTNTPGQTIANKTRSWLCADGEKADHTRGFQVITATIRNATGTPAQCTFPVAVETASGVASFDGVQTMTIPAGEAMALRVEEAVERPKSFHHASIRCDLPIDAYQPADPADVKTLAALTGGKATDIRTLVEQRPASPESTAWTAELELAAFAMNAAKQVHVLRSAQTASR